MTRSTRCKPTTLTYLLLNPNRRYRWSNFQDGGGAD